MYRILGVDLAGKDGNPTGFCLIMGDTVLSIGEFRTLGGLKEYIGILRPTIVAIDSPLNLPRRGQYRDCDILLRKYGIQPLPPMMKSMRMLVDRAIILVEFLKSMGIEYIETFPAGALKMLGFQRKPRSKNERRKMFQIITKKYGLRRMIDPSDLTKDEFDGFICAIVGYTYIKNMHMVVRGEECEIILPKPITGGSLRIDFYTDHPLS